MRVGLRLPIFVRSLASGTSGNLFDLVDYVAHGASYYVEARQRCRIYAKKSL